MKKSLFLIAAYLIIVSCQYNGRNLQVKTLFTPKVSTDTLLHQEGTSIKTRFNPPKGFVRLQTNNTSFAYYPQNFPLQPHNAKVHLYNGELKYRQDVHSAILAIDVGKRDLQQCADATMRLRAEYLYQQKRYNQIHFNFTNGFKASYAKWRMGYRIKVKGNSVTWVKSAKPSDSYASFRKYLVQVFSYAGTLSLAKELPSVTLENLKIGDLFIQGGSPGHAIVVVDMAQNQSGEKMFLLAQSYMPAQEIHILKNPMDTAISPWYSSKNLDELRTPEWVFTKNDIKRFY